MHELGIMTGVLSSVEEAARQAGAERVLAIHLQIGVMTEAIEDALSFAFEALSPETLCEGAELSIEWVEPRSVCFECGHEFDHDRFHLACPSCGSLSTKLIAGREMMISSIEVDLPDEPAEGAGGAPKDAPSASPENR